MAISGFLFEGFRLLQIITLIPIIGMLAYFVHGYVASNQLTPTYILVEFIASVLAAAWAIGTFLTYRNARRSGIFVALVDLAFVGTFIAAVYELRGIAKANCVNFTTDGTDGTNFTAGGFYFGSSWGLDTNKTCAMLKACFALGIIEIILFFITFLLALLVGRRYSNKDNEKVVVRREYHGSRHGQRRSPRGSREYHSRPGSSRRSHSQSRRRYYV